MNEKNLRIISAILFIYGVDDDEFTDTKKRMNNISECRHCVYYIFHTINGYSLRTIKRILKMSGDAHNINYGIKKMTRIIDGIEDSCIEDRFKFIESLIKTVKEQHGSRFNREIYK